ncbi:rhomboid family intramembrane serine protease [Candidatus Bathyarchaeota archaeon]|nr:rhomboid family intramembrane serine protease [Candidatus Bathyarchaeota archaeon]
MGAAASKKTPIFTIAIIAVNIVVYAVTSFENLFIQVGNYWVSMGGYIPALLAEPPQWYRIFTSMFLHADIFHILFNMYFLYLFGRAVEEALGGGRFLALYLASGVAASIFHTAFSFIGGSTAYVTPAIGASGAISGVLGAYLLLYPGTSLIMGWWFFPFPFFIRLKAAYYLIFWFAAQVFYGYAQAAGSTAVFAHAGGFIAGMALLPLVVNRERILQLKMVSRINPPYYLVFAPARREGLGRSAKIVVALILASLLAGAAYASTGFADPGAIKSASIQYTCGGIPYVDYLGVQLPDVESAVQDISLDTTRILLNRLYASGLLYDVAKADKQITIAGETLEVPVRIQVGGRITVVDVNMTVNYFSGAYDGDGFLRHGEGNIATQAVSVQLAYGPGYRLYQMINYEPITYEFSMSAQTVELAGITQYSALASLAASAAAIAVVLKKDRDLTLVGEETEVYRPYFGTPI